MSHHTNEILEVPGKSGQIIYSKGFCAGSAEIRQMAFEYKLFFTPLSGLGLRPSGKVFLSMAGLPIR
jgi:hypothetical protein